MEDFSKHAIYTMRHSSELGYIHTSGGSGTFVERKSWRTGLDLFRQAQSAGLSMPVIFSAAEEDSGLIYYARLTAVELDEDRGTTSYSFADLLKIEPARPKSALKLISTGNNLSDDYIRPYAVCETPVDLASWPLGGALPPMPKKRLTGEERFRSSSRDLDLSLIDFWRWSASDIVDNTIRGDLAEFIVASALGLAGGVRVGWERPNPADMGRFAER